MTHSLISIIIKRKLWQTTERCLTISPTAINEYDKDKTDYFYDLKISFHKKLITKRAIVKIRVGFDE
jgi:hypothetical protein